MLFEHPGHQLEPLAPSGTDARARSSAGSGGPSPLSRSATFAGGALAAAPSDAWGGGSGGGCVSGARRIADRNPNCLTRGFREASREPGRALSADWNGLNASRDDFGMGMSGRSPARPRHCAGFAKLTKVKREDPEVFRFRSHCGAADTCSPATARRAGRRARQRASSAATSAAKIPTTLKDSGSFLLARVPLSAAVSYKLNK